MNTTDYTNNAPYLNDEQIEIEQITVDAWYHNDLIKIAKLTKEYFNLTDENTNDKILIKNKIKKLL